MSGDEAAKQHRRRRRSKSKEKDVDVDVDVPPAGESLFSPRPVPADDAVDGAPSELFSPRDTVVRIDPAQKLCVLTLSSLSSFAMTRYDGACRALKAKRDSVRKSLTLGSAASLHRR